VCFVVRKTISELERAILTTPFLSVQKTPTVGMLGRGFAACFSSSHSMVPSTSIAIVTDGVHFPCGAFSLDETVHLRNFEFIANYFGD
jgi:hypothetical protein